jgi:class 3 adenylate cyclase/CHASE2 domain-containing sensor protein
LQPTTADPEEGLAENGRLGAATGDDKFDAAPAPAETPQFEEPVRRPESGRVLGIDILFDRLERPYEKYLFDEGKMVPPEEQDRMAVDALKYCDNVTYVSFMKFPDEEKGEDAAGVGIGDEAQKYKEISGKDMIHNVPMKTYMIPGARSGFSNVIPDLAYDGRIRKAVLFHYTKDSAGNPTYLFSFPIITLAAHLGVPDKDIKVIDNKILKVGEYEIPVVFDEADQSGKIYINYSGRGYETYDAIQFMGARATKEDANKKNSTEEPLVEPRMKISPFLNDAAWKNSIMLIGVTDTDIKDTFETPIGTLNGIEIHKAVLDTILQGDYLRDASTGVVVLCILVGALLVTFCTLLRLWAGVASIFAFGGGYFFFTLFAFDKHGLVLPIVNVLISLPLNLAAAMLYRNLVVDREKNAVKKIFKSYVAPHVLAELMENPADLKLGGSKNKVSVLFSDIRGFTTISEKLPPDILIKGLNHYLSSMTKIILDNDGMVDKFIGDAVMAVWGAPVARDDDAIKAVNSAILMKDKLAEINPRIKELTNETFSIGVGVNTGVVTLGNIGSEGKLDYTVIGDAVNLASRLESLTKQYGAFLIISEFTHEEVKDLYDCRRLDLVKVKGKAGGVPVGIYEPLCKKGNLGEQFKKMLEFYNAGLKLQRELKFEEAIKEFEKAREVMPDDKACKLYIDRCNDYMKEPPPKDWDGSYEWKTK